MKKAWNRGYLTSMAGLLFYPLVSVHSALLAINEKVFSLLLVRGGRFSDCQVSSDPCSGKPISHAVQYIYPRVVMLAKYGNINIA